MESDTSPAADSAAHGSAEHVPASLLDSTVPGGRVAGRLSLTPHAVRFEADPRSVALPLDGLEVRLGGASDRLVFFAHASQPGISIYTAKRSILRHPALRTRPELARQIAGISAKKLRGRLFVAGVLAAAVLAVVGLFALRGPLVSAVASQVPPSVEVRLGRLIFSQIEASSDLIDDPALEARLEQLVAPLLAAVPQDDYPYDLHLARDPSINAFAIPGGPIVLHSGLVLEAETAEEVLGVLAHEIAHVTERHTLRQMLGTASLYLLVQALLGDASGLVAVVADGGLQLISLRFSRDFEREADDVGWRYLLDAGIDPRGMIRLFERLAAQVEPEADPADAGNETDGGEAHDGSALALLSTHPTTQERIDRLNRKWEALSDPPSSRQPSSEDFRELQEALRAHLSTRSE